MRPRGRCSRPSSCCPGHSRNGHLNGGQGQSKVRQASASHRAKAGLSYPRATLEPNVSATLRDQLIGELEGISSAEEVANWAHRVIGSKNSLATADAENVEQAFQLRLANIGVQQKTEPKARRPSRRRRPAVLSIDKSVLALPAPRRIRDRDHVKSVAKQPCLVCSRHPSDAHHLKFAQSPALGRKVSDEFTVRLCRGHHREVHRCGDEAVWWNKTGIDATAAARVLWLKTHPLPNAVGAISEKLPNEPAAACHIIIEER